MSLFHKNNDQVLVVILSGNRSIFFLPPQINHGFFSQGQFGTGFGSKTLNYTFFMKNSTVLKLQAPWEKVKERMKENDISLTDEDLEYIPGKEEELIQRLEKIMNRSRDQVIAYIESISSNEHLAG